MKPENQNLEYKEIWKDEYLKVLVAFANAQGGTLVLGIKDNGDLVGVDSSSKLMEEIPNKANNILGITPIVNRYNSEQKEIIEITVVPYTTPISYKGHYYIRSGATVQELKGSNLQQFLLAKANVTWDEIICEKATPDNFDVNTINKFKNLAAHRLPEISQINSVESLLSKLRLSNNGAFSNAAVLLFCNDPQQFFMQAQTKIGRFDNGGNLLGTNLIEGNLFSQLQEILDLLRIKYLPGKISFEGVVRKDDSIIPEMVLREAVINALIHRIYNTTLQVNIKVFDDRLEVQNPGRLPDELTTADLEVEHLSIPRNKLLADCFYKAGLIEAWGRGTLLIRNLCKASGLPVPEFFQDQHTFKLIIHFNKNNGGVSGGVSGGVKKVTLNDLYNYILENPGKRTEELAEKLDLSKRTLERWLKKLKDSNKVIYQGSTKTGGYMAKID